jgi:hypothetical protein
VSAYHDGIYSSGPVMEADGSVNLAISFRGEEKKLDAAGGLLPLVADNRLHDISFRLFVFGQNGRRPVEGFQTLASVVEKLFVGYEVPLWLLILELNFDEVLLAAEVKNRPFEGRLDEAFDSPGLSALDCRFVNDMRPGMVNDLGNLLLSFCPAKSERRWNLLGTGWECACQAQQTGHKP